MKKPVSAVLAALALLAAVLSFNAARFGSRQIHVPPNDEATPAMSAAAQRLAQAVHFQTLSNQDPTKFPGAEFKRFHAFLSRNFPRMQSALRKERINGYSLLYEWPGTDPALKPVLVMAHQDVVPIDPVSAGQWLQPPFAGVIADGFIWGRGTLDDKGAVMALHEAAESLLTQGFRPRRTMYFAFGHDEEVGGQRGGGEDCRDALVQRHTAGVGARRRSSRDRRHRRRFREAGGPDRYCRERLSEPRIRGRRRRRPFLDAAPAHRRRYPERGHCARRSRPVSPHDFRSGAQPAHLSRTRAGLVEARHIFKPVAVRSAGESADGKSAADQRDAAYDDRAHHARRQHQGECIADARARRDQLAAAAGNE